MLHVNHPLSEKPLEAISSEKFKRIDAARFSYSKKDSRLCDVGSKYGLYTVHLRISLIGFYYNLSDIKNQLVFTAIFQAVLLQRQLIS